MGTRVPCPLPSTAVCRAVLALTLLAPAIAPPSAAAEPALPRPEAALVAEAYRITGEIGEAIWPGFSRAPFPIVLVTQEREFLIGWEGPPPEGFGEPFVDPRLSRGVRARERVFSPTLAAAFPAFGPPSVVVIGTLQATGRSPAAWVLTLLHEHFHQLQNAAPDYYREVEALDLSGGDTSGMWMLEYPFPYDDEAVGERWQELAGALHDALSTDAPGAPAWDALDAVVALLEPADARYLQFQLWQEGVARHLELRAAAAAADGPPGDGLAALASFTGWRHAEQTARKRILDELAAAALADQERVAFYAAGAALGMLLDRDDPGWRGRYLDRRFTLERPAPAGVEITYLANEGFLLAAGDDKVLVDALFPGIDGYSRVPADVGARLAGAETPFDGVDLVLATHFHRDHFGATETARFLDSSAAGFVSTPDAAEQLQQAAGRPLDVIARFPAEGERWELRVSEDLGVTLLNLHHGRDRPQIQNLGFLIEIGGVKVLHVGDTEVTPADLEPYGLASAGIDVALLPGWLFAEPSWRPVVAAIGARHLVVMHLAAADAPASWFGSAGSREGRIALIREHFPEAWIPTDALASRFFAPVP